MAQKLITYANLQTYDGLIKQYIATEQGKDIKTVLFDSTNKQIKFYKKESATLADTADYSISIPADLDGSATIASVSEGVVTLKAGITETDGIVSNADSALNPDITLAKVATTGTAADVAIVDAGSLITATDVEGALQELASASAGGVESKTIWFTDNSAGQSDYAKVYKIWQGANAPDHATAPATLIGTMNIPLDKVLQDSSIVTITYDDGKLYDGLVDVTELIKGAGGTATAADAGKYMKFIMQNVTDPLYVNLEDFIDIYTGGSNTEATVSIDANNEITVTIGEVAATKSIYKDAAPATYTQVEAGDTFDENETYYTEDAGVYTVDSTVNAENFDSKVAAGLYIQATPAVAKQTVKAKLDELDYVVASTAEINALFS